MDVVPDTARDQTKDLSHDRNHNRPNTASPLASASSDQVSRTIPCDEHRPHSCSPSSYIQSLILNRDRRRTGRSWLDTLGWVYYKLSEFNRAAQHLELSLATRESTSAYVHLAQVLIDLGELNAAFERLIKAEGMQPNAETQDEIDRLKDDIQRKRALAG